MGCGASMQPTPGEQPLDPPKPMHASSRLAAVGAANGAGSGELRAWLGFVKLDEKFPSKPMLETLLYNSSQGSAEGCDVIALSLTDLKITEETLPGTRHLLKNALKNPGEYVFNEDDDSLVFRHVPAQLVKTMGGGGARYCSLHVAVRKGLVKDTEYDMDRDHYDCFPVPVQLACKSSRRNEFSPTFKSVLVQEIVLWQGEKEVDLMLIGANFDTNDVAKLGQIEALERLIRHEQRTQCDGHPFVALIWGDFNNRLVAWDGLQKQHWQPTKKGGELTDKGTELLGQMISTAQGRRCLPAAGLLSRGRDLLTKDSMCYSGKDMRGEPFVMPACNVKLQELFKLCTDAGPELEIPMPSYKQIPFDVRLSEQLGVHVKLTDAISLHQVAGGRPVAGAREQVKELHVKDQKINRTYFSWQDLQGNYPQVPNCQPD